MHRTQKDHTTPTSRLFVSAGRIRIEGGEPRATVAARSPCSALFAQQTSPPVLGSRFALLEDCYDQNVRAEPAEPFELAGARRR